MATPFRCLARRVFRDRGRKFIVLTTQQTPKRFHPANNIACRCYSTDSENKSTHFGFETVPEEEKAERGKLHIEMSG